MDREMLKVSPRSRGEDGADGEGADQLDRQKGNDGSQPLPELSGTFEQKRQQKEGD